MRVNVQGLYLKYPDIGEPIVGPLTDRLGVKTLYVFNRHNDRTFLVTDWTHLKYLLEFRHFDVVGAEVEESELKPVKSKKEKANA